MTEPAEAPVEAATLAATASFTSTGSLTAPKLGDVLTYTVSVTGDQGTFSPGTLTVLGQSIPIALAPISFTLPEAFGPPIVNGITLTTPFAQQADPHVWKATV